MGADYGKVRKYQTHSKGAQEAHEAIRPTYIDNVSIDGTSQESACMTLSGSVPLPLEMADAQIEKTTVNISLESEEGQSTTDLQFVANGEVVAFEGFLKGIS